MWTVWYRGKITKLQHSIEPSTFVVFFFRTNAIKSIEAEERNERDEKVDEKEEAAAEKKRDAKKDVTRDRETYYHLRLYVRVIKCTTQKNISCVFRRMIDSKTRWRDRMRETTNRIELKNNKSANIINQ